jgi:hypothetical protein
VLGELVQDVPVVQMSQVQEVPIPQAQEAPMTQALDGSGATLLQGVPSQEELSADDAPVGPFNIGADGVDPQSGDDAGSLHRDMVVWGTNSCTPGHTTLGNTVPTLESSGAVGPGVVGLLLPGYPDSPFSPVDCGKCRIVRSRHVCKSRLLRECCMRHWPRSAGISCIQFGLV